VLDVTGAPGVDRRGPRRRLTIRARLTLSYAGLVTGCGAVLITLVYLYMRYVPNYRIAVADIPTAVAEANEVTEFSRTSPAFMISSQEDFLNNLLIASGIALLVLALLGGIVGWIVAGRIIQPLTTISLAARRASTGALDHRIGLDGPRDEIRDLAETFNHMLGSLERSFTAHRRFTANASHELRTPLATTKTMIDVTLGDPAADAAELRALAERIRDVNHSSIETVDALLDLAAAENATFAQERIDLAEIAHTTVRDLADEARRARITIDGPSGAAVVMGSAVLIRQAISNLMRNAIRHNHPNGHVTVRISAQPGLARVTIANTGPELSRTDAELLAEPFARGSGRSLTRGTGQGLGLAIVKAVVSANKGVLILTPNSDGGLTATIELVTEDDSASR
jgi:two-component system sensor histidine kinase VanS